MQDPSEAEEAVPPSSEVALAEPNASGSGAPVDGASGSVAPVDDAAPAETADEAPADEAPEATEAERRRAGWSCLAVFVLALGAVVAMVTAARERVRELVSIQPGVMSPSDEDALPPGEGQPRWVRSLERARVRAAAEGLPLAIHFEASWAASSQLAFGGTYADARVEEALEGWVTARLDVDAHEALAGRLGVDRLPHLAFVDAAFEPLVPGLAGVAGPEAVLARAEEALAAFAARTAEDRPGAEAPLDPADDLEAPQGAP
ncbi:MAG: hypothetical protein AAF447_18085 [Myxococcota bacterium]